MARELVAQLERTRPLLTGSGERFSGYGVLGLPFTLGHVLAFRRFAASSIGPPYTSVWHRTPDGRWTCYVDVEPSRSCPRYFGSALAGVVRAQIDLAWTGPQTVAVSVPRHRLEWAVRVEAVPATRLFSAAGILAPPVTLRSERFLSRLGPLAGRVLNAGSLSLTGRAPNGQRFMLLPRRVWSIIASAAVVQGRDVGPLGPLPVQPAVGEFLVPNRGLFGLGEAWFEEYDPRLHRPVEPEAPGAHRPATARGA